MRSLPEAPCRHPLQIPGEDPERRQLKDSLPACLGMRDGLECEGVGSRSSINRSISPAKPSCICITYFGRNDTAQANERPLPMCRRARPCQKHTLAGGVVYGRQC